MKVQRSSIRLSLIILFSTLCFTACTQETGDRCGRKILSQTEVIVGADRVDEYLSLLSDRRVAVLTNQNGRIGTTHLVDTLLSLGVDLKLIFCPEHGFRGEAPDGAKISNEIDQKTGIQIISLYGSNKKPTAVDLAEIDILIFDLQDVGARFYTFLSTLHYAMEACAENSVRLILLDRPNPNGFYVDGPVLEPDFSSFIGIHQIPIVHGMTLGELALMINGEKWLIDENQADLIVIPCVNYDHTTSYRIPLPPSPNLPNLRSVLLYPSLCLLEGSTVSVGRGTDYQFQIFGHPTFQNGNTKFTPMQNRGSSSPKWENSQCTGYDLTNMNPEELVCRNSIDLSFLIIAYEEIGENDFFRQDGYFDKLAGNSQLRKQLEAGLTENEIRASWNPHLQNFIDLRMDYLLYSDPRYDK